MKNITGIIPHQFKSKLDQKGKDRLKKEVAEGKTLDTIFVWLCRDYRITPSGAYYLVEKTAKELGLTTR